MSRTRTRPLDLDQTHGRPEDIDHITQLVTAVRPDWDARLVQVVLLSHAPNTTLADLTCAALRCAQDPVLPPRAIGWRGPHWDGAKVPPEYVEPQARCGVCGKTEPRCVMERPGRDDDHDFEPARRSA